jgi:GntR family transcriptional regulator / MocR family aminotransferase
LFSSWGRKLMAAALRADTSYPVAEGYLPLRHALAEYVARRRGIVCDSSDILVVAGTQQALTLIERVVLNPKERVVLEDPHYQLAKHSLLAHGARIVSGRTDEQGLVIRELPQQPARLTLVTPSHQFPSGVVMSLSRRLELLKWAAQVGSWIIEDDYDTEFDAADCRLPALATLDLAGRVIYVGSFSKTIFPSLRLGYIVCPKTLRDYLFKTKLLNDLGSPAIEQAALATFIRSGHYEKHLRKSIVELATRRRIVIETLQRLAGADIEFGAHDCGMHFVIWLRHIDFHQITGFIAHAKSLGLGLDPVHPYYVKRPDRPGLLIGFAGLPLGQLKTAVELLASCLKHKAR